MTLAQERDVWQEYQHATGEEREHIEEELLKEHERLAHSIRLKFKTTLISREDMVQLSMIGLMNAIRKFDPSSGNQFSTFATPVIFNFLHQKIAHERADKRLANIGILSLDVPVGDENKKKNDLIDLIADTDKPVDAFVTDRNMTIDVVRKSREILSEREYRAFWLRYGSDDPMYYADIAERLGVSQNGAKLICERALYKIKRHYDPSMPPVEDRKVIRVYQRWTKDEKEKIRELLLDGLDVRSTAEHFPYRSFESVRGTVGKIQRALKKEGLL